MKKVAIYGAFGLLVSVSAQADFQYELGAGYIDDSIGDGYVVSASAYLESVDTSSGPLAEAVFLNKASGVTLAFNSQEGQIDDEDTVTLMGRYVFDSDFFGQFEYNDRDYDSDFELGVGKYLTDESEVVLSYGLTDESEIDTIKLTMHAFSEIYGGSSFSYDLGVGYADGPSDGGEIASGGITYYGTPEFGIGIYGERVEIGTGHSQVYGVNAEYFFKENMAVSLDYSAADTSNGFASSDVDTLALFFTARF